jgi:hypothetical protein
VLAPEPVWTFGRTENALVPIGVWTQYRPARSLITILNNRSRLMGGR